MKKYTEENLDFINDISVLDYFRYLENEGKVQFEKKTGHDTYYRTEEAKYSVSDSGFYDFKTGEGGKIIKAVMAIENKTWIEAVGFLKEFNGNIVTENADKKIYSRDAETKPAKIEKQLIPNNEKLISYFEERGISKDILVNNSLQIHYEAGGRNYFGIGMENLSGGFEIRNPMIKTKIGRSDISIIPGTKNETIVFEGMTDTLSFLQLLKNNSTINNRNLTTLNSVVNVDKFIEKYQDYDGKIFLCLDGDKAGNDATNKIISSLPAKNIKDVRTLYEISETKHNDLNEYLKNKTQLNITKNEPITRRNEVSSPEQTRTNLFEQNNRGADKEGQSEQRENIDGGQRMDSNDVGDGPGGAIGTDSRPNDRGFTDRKQHTDVGETPGSSLGGGLDLLLEKYKGKKLNNEQVAEVVSEACIVSAVNKITVLNDLQITDELTNIVSQFKSGGIQKSGRGVLDEYYTEEKIVDAVRNLIKDHFKGRKEISVLEPSVGTGNFIYAATGLGIKTTVTAFEINETTAKIAKIFHPEADINFRSFETEFIDDKGNKTLPENIKKYDLIIGNPPYGEHRGLYKGLGEESKIAKYEDYFVKRSIDSLSEGGIIAMVLPSSWISRQKKMLGAEMINAFRLPSGAFAGTQIGTDIIILKKDEKNLVTDMSQYFENKPEHILGDVREKSNRFGRLEKYVHGNLDDALEKIENLQKEKGIGRIGNLFEDFLPDEIVKPPARKENTPPKKTTENSTIDKNEVEQKVNKVILKLSEIKFKSPAIVTELKKYEKLSEQLKNRSTFSEDDLRSTIEKSNRIISFHSNTAESEYRIQTQPEIKKGVLKYQFLKEDSVVNTSLQNASGLTEEQIAAFKATSYDGRITNYSKHFDFVNYYKEEYIHDFYYAEGNIYEKLAQLEKDYGEDWGIGGLERKQYEKQKALLENVLPKPKTLDQISISPNHEFVRNFALGQIEKDQYNYTTKRTETVVVDYNLAEKFKDFVSNLPSDVFAGSSSWEVKGFVDNETVTGSDKERNALVRERRKTAANDIFHKFIREELSEELRDGFVESFNKHYNNIHVPDYSKFPLFSKIHQNFKGKELRLTEVQKAGIGRQTTKGVGLLAHEVGFGKTLSGILSMHEAMERKNAFRPLIVVPNDSILKQWVETVFETIPEAKVNVLGNLGKDYDLSRFDNKDGEITIVTYEGFNNIGFSNEITEKLSSKFNYISANELKSITNTEREHQIDLQKEKEIEGKMKRGKVYDWEDFGFDHLTFDEVHNANHIVGKVKIEDRRFSSDFRNQNQQTSKLGINTWMAAQYIQEKQNGRNVTLLSATPFTNKPLEYYSILSLIANKRLEESGYFNVNTFFETFMEADTDMEIDAKGDVKFKANVRRFKNNSLFQQLLSEFIDIKGEEDNPELVRPNKINKEYRIAENALTKEQYDLLNDNFSQTAKGAILTHILNARLIAISPYLSPYYDLEEPSVKEFVENSPKLNETMNLIRQNKRDIPESGQIIYSELAVAQFSKLKEYLINEVGFTPEEIGIINGDTSKKNRIILQDDFNSGKVKIIIGSEAIQEGMNLQENTTDLYLLSLPYNFTTLRQVEGRAWRQGNKHENVRVNFMLQNDSIDIFMLQKLQAKQSRYIESMKKGANVLDISDISTEELKTAIITNPETRANIEIELIKKRLESEKNKFLADSAFVLRKYDSFLKVQENVTKAELRYNQIVGYSKEGTDNSDYWMGQLPFYQKTIDLAKVEVQKEITDLAKKGVNVSEIENQTKVTQDKITALETELENLPETKSYLINKYYVERTEKLAKEKEHDIIAERKNENMIYFSKMEESEIATRGFKR